MKISIALAMVFLGVAFCDLNDDNPSPTPRRINCPNKLCHGKADGNYPIDYEQHHFLQCSGGVASCQACWPKTLYYSGKCNQCMYNIYDDCYTTQEWEPATTFFCPDACPHYKGKDGKGLSGNIKDKNNPRQYIACWEGVTVGCVACPNNLEFNQEKNACLYEGKYMTEPLDKPKH